MENKHVWRKIGDVLLYVIVFAVIQIVVTLVGTFVWNAVDPETTHKLATNTEMSPVLIALASVFSNVITFILFLRLRWTPVSRSYLASRPWFSLVWVALFTLGAMIPQTFVNELLGVEMSPEYEKMFEGMMKEPWGYVAIGLLAPLAEEVVFRGAVLRKLLELMGHKWRWGAIVISAAVFGALHGNNAQFCTAFVMGIVLGWMYYRTRSIVPGIAMHFVNNSTVYVLANLLPNSNDKLIDIFNGSQQAVYMAVLFSLCIAVPSLYQMILRLKRAQ